MRSNAGEWVGLHHNNIIKLLHHLQTILPGSIDNTNEPESCVPSMLGLFIICLRMLIF